MAVFSTNQNRQLYVAKSVGATDSEGGIKLVTNGNQMYFQYKGADGLLRSDLIDKSSVTYVKYTTADKLQRKLKTAVIQVAAEGKEDGKFIAGQDYVVKIYINNYLAPGDSHVAVKLGYVHATSIMNDQKFYEELAKSLTANFSKEVQPLLTFTASASGVTVTEVKQPYVLGTRAQEEVNFDIMVSPITKDGEEVIWAVVDEKTGKVAVQANGAVINNGTKIADLEYFCMGERGDQYRKVAGIQAIPVKYMVNSDNAYNVLDIHYSFSDTGVNVQKSEKDITIVSEASLEALATAVNNFVEGITAE